MKNLEQELESYIDGKAGVWSPTTLLTASSKLRTIISGGFRPDSLYERLSEAGYSRYSIKTYFTLAKQFETETYKTSTFKTWIEGNRRHFKNCYKKKERSITTEQFDSFLAKAPNDNIYNFLVLMGRGGLRKSEAFKTSWDKIKETRLEVESGKGGKQRFIPFLRTWLKDPETTGSVLPLNLNYWSFFKSIGFTPHDFRAYYATKVVNIPGMSIEDARELLGHEDIKTTAKYLRADKDRQQKLVMENF